MFPWVVAPLRTSKHEPKQTHKWPRFVYQRQGKSMKIRQLPNSQNQSLEALKRSCRGVQATTERPGLQGCGLQSALHHRARQSRAGQATCLTCPSEPGTHNPGLHHWVGSEELEAPRSQGLGSFAGSAAQSWGWTEDTMSSLGWGVWSWRRLRRGSQKRQKEGECIPAEHWKGAVGSAHQTRERVSGEYQEETRGPGL